MNGQLLLFIFIMVWAWPTGLGLCAMNYLGPGDVKEKAVPIGIILFVLCIASIWLAVSLF